MSNGRRDLSYPQNVRLLLVISNFGYLLRSLLPSMMGELEAAFGIVIENDKQVIGSLDHDC